METGGKLPDFIIIGAMKCGTTTLWEYLSRHPDVYMVDHKEPNFFSDDEKYHLGEDWYRSLFSQAEVHQLCGEASTDYAQWPKYPDVPERIRKLIPGVRLIYIMRHPVERAYSHYAFKYKMARKNDTPTFEEAIKQDRNLLETGLYMRQLEQYLDHFDKDNILCILLDDLKNNTRDVLNKMQRFIGVTVCDLCSDEPVLSNVAGDKLLRKKLKEDILNKPGMSFLSRKIPGGLRKKAFKFIKTARISKKITQDYGAYPMTEQTREMLTQYYSEPNQMLGEYIGRDLSGWR